MLFDDDEDKDGNEDVACYRDDDGFGGSCVDDGDDVIDDDIDVVTEVWNGAGDAVDI